jgi:hypothetical protein
MPKDVHIFRTGPNQPIDPATDNLTPTGVDAAEVAAMNDRGDFVGYFSTFDGDVGHGGVFVCLGSTIIDLNDVIEPDSGWRLEEVYDINNRGQIVGFGYHDGQKRAFRFDPIPEPSSVLVMCAVGVVACCQRRRRIALDTAGD